MRNNLLIALALVVSQVSGALAGEPDKDLHNKCIYPTVMIGSTNEKYGGTGTGVIVKSVKEGEKWTNYVFTCSHILIQTPPRIILPPKVNGKDDITKNPTFVDAKYEYQVRVGNYQDWSHLVSIDDYECEVLITNRSRLTDTALIKFTSDKEMPVAETNDEKLYIGNEICRVGCGLDEPFRVDFGRITSISKSTVDRYGDMTKHTHRVSAATLPGDSGGPVYEGYKLIGLMQLIRGFQGQDGANVAVFHMAYVIPIERFTSDEAIMDCLDGKDPPKTLADIIREAMEEKEE
jgi:S1-C subfamily serine protease